MDSDRLIEVLTRIAVAQEQLLLKIRLRMPIAEPVAPPFPKLVKMTRLQVQELLGFGESTYKRRVKEGRLNPMKLGGTDQYNQHELEALLEESRRRGRI